MIELLIKEIFDEKINLLNIEKVSSIKKLLILLIFNFWQI